MARGLGLPIKVEVFERFFLFLKFIDVTLLTARTDTAKNRRFARFGRIGLPRKERRACGTIREGARNVWALIHAVRNSITIPDAMRCFEERASSDLKGKERFDHQECNLSERCHRLFFTSAQIRVPDSGYGLSFGHLRPVDVFGVWDLGFARSVSIVSMIFWRTSWLL
jgi:hypothetical protein